MTEIETLHDVYGRIVSGEPIRILIGHVLHRSIEIEPAGGYAQKLRADLLRGLGERIAALQPSPDDPSPQSPALPAEGGKPDRASGGQPTASGGQRASINLSTDETARDAAVRT